MGKYAGKSKKQKPKDLEIVPKAVEQEVQLPEARKSDDPVPKKVTY